MGKLEVTISNPNNPKKIPEMIFVEDIEEYVLKHTAETIMESFQDAYSKYKYLEMHITRQKDNMAMKIPEIERALEIIKQLSLSRETETEVDYMVCDTIYSKATVSKDIEKVNLWLGANTMVEFTFEEAKKLLSRNLENAQNNLNTFETDLSFLKDQITKTEVNIARVYNANIKLKSEGKVKEVEKESQQQQVKAQ